MFSAGFGHVIVTIEDGPDGCVAVRLDAAGLQMGPVRLDRQSSDRIAELFTEVVQLMRAELDELEGKQN